MSEQNMQGKNRTLHGLDSRDAEHTLQSFHTLSFLATLMEPRIAARKHKCNQQNGDQNSHGGVLSRTSSEVSQVNNAAKDFKQASKTDHECARENSSIALSTVMYNNIESRHSLFSRMMHGKAY